jgi:hypothetical protein
MVHPEEKMKSLPESESAADANLGHQGGVTERRRGVHEGDS